MNARNASALPTRSALRSAVERACADLPAPRRRHVVDELIAHLQELPRDEADGVLNDVAGYVTEMREAWGLEIVDARPSVRRRLIATVVAAVLVAAGVGAVIGAWNSGGSDSAAGRNAVVVPTLFGLTQDKATALLASVGLRASVDYQPRPEALGTVLSQQPAEGVKVGRASRVVMNVAAPVGGPLLTSMPTRAVPPTQIAAINTGTSLVLYYAAISVGGPPVFPKNRMVTVGGISAPIPFVGGPGPGVCTAVSDITVGVGGPVSGACIDPRQLARIIYTDVDGYICGLTSLPATSVRIHMTGTPVGVTVATRTSSQLNGLHFFIAKLGTARPTSPPPVATITALDNNGKALLSITEPSS